MFTPKGPSAWPSAGAGLAMPAGTSRRATPLIAAIIHESAEGRCSKTILWREANNTAPVRAAVRCCGNSLLAKTGRLAAAIGGGESAARAAGVGDECR